MTFWNEPWLLAALVPALLLAGAGAHRAWANHKSRKQRRIPKHWPLSTRALVNSEEARVWHWLARAFYDHHIMIKLPVAVEGEFVEKSDASSGGDKALQTGANVAGGVAAAMGFGGLRFGKTRKFAFTAKPGNYEEGAAKAASLASAMLLGQLSALR